MERVRLTQRVGGHRIRPNDRFQYSAVPPARVILELRVPGSRSAAWIGEQVRAFVPQLRVRLAYTRSGFAESVRYPVIYEWGTA